MFWESGGLSVLFSMRNTGDQGDEEAELFLPFWPDGPQTNVRILFLFLHLPVFLAREQMGRLATLLLFSVTSPLSFAADKNAPDQAPVV
jgi:hypothetical protein